MRLRISSAVVAASLLTGLMVSGHAQGKGTKTPSPLLSISRSGKVLHSPGVTAIFWGPEWSDAGFAGDIVDGLEVLFQGYSSSAYAEVATEYYDATGPITMFAPYTGRVMDPSAPPAPGGLSATVAIDEVCRITSNRPNPNDVYIVYTSTDKGTRDNTWCKFHTWGTCGAGKNAVPVQVAGVPFANGEAGTGCDGVQDTSSGHSLALAQMANLTVHALVETITNPRGTGWRDDNGQEIAHKCLLTFPQSPAAYPLLSNGSTWKLQGLWSNAAYLANSGTLNQLGQPGCRW
jgi:hypothetical protein